MFLFCVNLCFVLCVECGFHYCHLILFLIRAIIIQVLMKRDFSTIFCPIYFFIHSFIFVQLDIDEYNL